MTAEAKHIKTFVKEVMGCKCPDEVFTFINCEHNIAIGNNIVLRNRINIGNRLLIYVVDANPSAITEGSLMEIVSSGIRERDQKKFKRFRLVIAVDNPDLARNRIERTFWGLFAHGGNIHLHIVKKDDILF